MELVLCKLKEAKLYPLTSITSVSIFLALIDKVIYLEMALQSRIEALLQYYFGKCRSNGFPLPHILALQGISPGGNYPRS